MVVACRMCLPHDKLAISRCSHTFHSVPDDNIYIRQLLADMREHICQEAVPCLHLAGLDGIKYSKEKNKLAITTKA